MYTKVPETIQTIINNIIKVEGGYSNEKNDSGGATKYGITEKVAHENGYTGCMQDLTVEFARNVYYESYVRKPGFDKVLALAGTELAAELIDSGVNCGISRSSKWLQRSLNSFNRRGKIYPDILVDGSIGPASLRALASLLDHRGAEEAAQVLTKACNCLQGAYYIELGEASDKNEDFTYGWILHRT